MFVQLAKGTELEKIKEDTQNWLKSTNLEDFRLVAGNIDAMLYTNEYGYSIEVQFDDNEFNGIIVLELPFDENWDNVEWVRVSSRKIYQTIRNRAITDYENKI